MNKCIDYIPIPSTNFYGNNFCYPIIINIILNYWNKIFKPEDIAIIAKIFSGTVCSILIDGTEFLELNGFIFLIYKGSINEIKKRLKHKIPLILILPGKYDIIQHSVIVHGYDHINKSVLIYDPQYLKSNFINETKFKNIWKEDDMITILIIPKDQKLVDKTNLKFERSNRLCFEAEKLFIKKKTMML